VRRVPGRLRKGNRSQSAFNRKLAPQSPKRQSRRPRSQHGQLRRRLRRAVDLRHRIEEVKLSAFWNETSATRAALNQIVRKAALTWPSLSNGKEGLHPRTSPAVPAWRRSTRKRSRSRIVSQFRRRLQKWRAHKSALSSRCDTIFRVIDNVLRRRRPRTRKAWTAAITLAAWKQNEETPKRNPQR
jgi:hypothetical protein